MELEFTHDAAEFLGGARDHLALDPVLNTVVATIAERAVAEIADGIEQPAEHWWLTVRDGGRVVGVAMRTAPFAPHPAYLLPMPQEAARLAAAALHERGEDQVAVNGALPAARVFLEETVRLAGGEVRVVQHTRLFELGTPVPARPVEGRLRSARADEVDLVDAWFTALMGDADDQAGRPRGSAAHETPTREDLLRRIGLGRVWFWEDADGEVVHMTGANAPAFGAARIGPVYTPPQRRGRGWASAAVAAVSQLILDGGYRACLFTDRANPTSNAIYEALGYRPVVEMANLTRAAIGSGR